MIASQEKQLNITYDRALAGGEEDYPKTPDGFCTRTFTTWILEKSTQSVVYKGTPRTMTVCDISIVERKGERVRARGWIHVDGTYRFVWAGLPKEQDNWQPVFWDWWSGEEITLLQTEQ